LSEAIQQIDDPELSASFHQKIGEKQQVQMESLSIAQRLMRRAHTQIFTVTLDYGLDIQVYAPTDSEIIELVKLQTDIFRVGTSMQQSGIDIDTVGSSVDVIADGYDRLNRLLGKLCVDPSLSYEFFASGAISSSDKGAIISGIMSNVNNSRESVSRFR
jgi:hypothetical protein